jgi:hypothetical protein
VKVLIFILTFSSILHAETFKIAGSLVELKKVDGLLVRGCEKKCDALTIIRKHNKISMAKVRKGQTFNNSIGSDVCDKVYKARSLLGVAENKDQRAFCYFKDKSMVEMNSLSDYLVDKKIVKF